MDKEMIECEEFGER